MGLLEQVIGSVLGQRSEAGRGGMNPLVTALLSLLASRAAGGGGGLGGLLGGLGGGPAGSSGGFGDLGGLGGLIERFTRSGHGDIINSWVGPGRNHPIAPPQLADALGDDTVDRLSQQTGMPRQDLLSELSQMLPGVVDKLTPQGRPPTRDELDRW